MNKKDLANVLAEVGLVKTKTAGVAVVEEIFKEIKHSLSKQEEVSIPEFGKFKVVETKERMGRHPKTGEEIKIEAGHKVKFLASKTLKELVK